MDVAAVTKPTDTPNINSTSEVDVPSGLILTYNICVTYITFIILIVAFPANILIITVLIHEKHRSHSTSVYFLSLALADLFVNFRTFNFWLVRSGMVKYSTDFECQIDKGYPLIGMLASSWTLATISIERMTSVYLPFTIKNVCNVKVARVVVTLIWSVSLCVALFNAWIHRIESDVCVVKTEYRDVFINHIIYLDYFLDSVVPFFIILFNSILTLARMSRRQNHSSTSSKAFGKSITGLVLMINAVFFVTQFPYGIIFIFQQLNEYSSSRPRLDYLEGITLVLKYVNYALNFYIYFLSASKFRQETKSILISCKQRCSKISCCDRSESVNNMPV